MKNSKINAVNLALVGAVGVIGAGSLMSDSNPFSQDDLVNGYENSNTTLMGKMAIAEGKCGESKNHEGEKKSEGSCGEKKAEGSCGEKKAEGSCGEKKAEGKCGEGKCGEHKGEKKAEGSCGEDKEGMKKSEGKCGS